MKTRSTLLAMLVVASGCSGTSEGTTGDTGASGSAARANGGDASSSASSSAPDGAAPTPDAGASTSSGKGDSGSSSGPDASADHDGGDDAIAPDAGESADATHALLGVYSDSFSTLNATVAAASGRDIAIENQRETWGTDFTQADEAYDMAHGIIPMISWAVAYNDSKTGGTCASYEGIVSGAYDDTWTDSGGASYPGLKQEAATLKGWGVPVLIRFYKEFTDTADDMCFYGVGDPANTPAQYGPMLVGSWQHVIDVFKAAGATNVQWVWGPSANLFGTTAPDDSTWRYFYPGSNYVDWLSADNYNKSDTDLLKYSADLSIANWYSSTSKVGKPLMQAETGAGYNASLSPDPMTVWIDDAYSTVKETMPAMKAFLWWSAEGQVDYDLQGQGLVTYEAMASDPYFKATRVDGYFSSAGGSGGPTAPTGVKAMWSGDTATVTWTASTDAHGTIDHYDVYRDDVVVGTATTTSFTDDVGTSGSAVDYTVDAVDSSLNRSTMSAALATRSP